MRFARPEDLLLMKALAGRNRDWADRLATVDVSEDNPSTLSIILPGRQSMSDVRTIRVFIASPGDLAVERAAFKQVLEELNAGFGDALDIQFEPLGWEDTLAATGRRSQEVINREIDRCDVFILAMHRRWGQAAPDAQPYSSYTEEEFHRAFHRWQGSGSGVRFFEIGGPESDSQTQASSRQFRKTEHPTPRSGWQKKRRGKPQAPEIFVFFKHIDSASMADAGPQLQKVLDFRKSLEESRQVLYHGFANEAEFKAEVDRHLRAFAKGELPKADAPLDKVLLPLAVLAEVQKEKAEKEQTLVRAERGGNNAELFGMVMKNTTGKQLMFKQFTTRTNQVSGMNS